MIDLITNLDMSAFHSLGGWDKMLTRLEMEWKECVHEAPTILAAEVKPAQDQPARAEGEEEGMEVCLCTSISIGLCKEATICNVERNGTFWQAA